MASYRLMCVTAVLSLLIPESASQLSICGRAPQNNRIVGGVVAPDNNWPWQASVLSSFSNRHFCGGFLVNEVWVLSAAHCFEGTSAEQVRVALGRQRQFGSNPTEQIRDVDQIINHPEYNTDTNDNDIALLRLDSAVSVDGSSVVPICLAAPDSSIHTGVSTFVTGWGTLQEGGSTSNELMEVEVLIVGNRQCNCNYGVGRITDNMICAGEEGKDACQGDSGGPLVTKQGDLWVGVGVVSFGVGCGRPDFPGVYARVSRYMSWINENIQTNQPGYVTITSTGTDSDLSVTCRGLPDPETSTTTTTTPPTTTPQPVVCGQAPLNSRIVNGSSVASAGIWPWMASLQMNGLHVCGGTLVSEDTVMSDADCISSSSVASEWTVVLGRLQQSGSNPFEVTLNVTNITMSSLSGSNVALLSLSSPPTLSNYIQPICLDDGRTFAEGTTCWAAGWSTGRGGDQQVLQEIQTSVTSCGNTSTSDSICTTNFTLEEGDVGGPLMCQLSGSWFQAAVLTLQGNTIRAVRADTVNVFDRVNRYDAFLRSNLGTFLSTGTTGGAAAHTGTLFSVLLNLLVLVTSLQLFL